MTTIPSTTTRCLLAGFALAACATAHAGDTPLLDEGFEQADLPDGWLVSNFSDNPVAPGWFKPQVTPDTFGAQSGTGGSYFASNVFIGATDAAGNPYGRVDALLLTPRLSMEQSTTLSFWTRTVSDSGFGDSLRVGAYVAGSYVDLMTLNPSLAVGVYPDGWTNYTVTLAAQGEGVYGRYFFEYRVPDASVAGNFIGLDSVQVQLTAVPEPAAALQVLAGLAMVAALRARRRQLRA